MYNSSNVRVLLPGLPLIDVETEEVNPKIKQNQKAILGRMALPCRGLGVAFVRLRSLGFPVVLFRAFG